MRSTASDFSPKMIAAFIDRRLTNILAPLHRACLLRYLTALLEDQRFPPYRRSKLDHHAVANELGVSADDVLAIRDHLQPIFDAVSRAVAEGQIRAGKPVRKTTGQIARPQKASAAQGPAHRVTAVPVSTVARSTRRPGRTPKPIIEFPVALATNWEEPETFGEALRLHAERHGESLYHLYDAVVRPEDRISRSTLLSWGRNAKAPRSVNSFQILSRIERRYALPAGYFRERIGHGGRACTGHDLAGVPPSERRRLAWHLPDDFNRRSKAERDEILHWVRNVIISGTTEYRRYQAAASRRRYAIRFQPSPGRRRRACVETDPEAAGIVDAPRRLNEEMKELLRFKTSTLAAFGLQRNGVWGTETASQKIEHFGLWFGAFVASPTSEVQGFGADPERLTFAMMIFPQVWDWYLQWRERRRGFYTKWEVDLLTIAAALTREETGWLRQTPRIGKHLMPIEGLISQDDIARALGDWGAACDAMHKHARRRIKEIERVARIHRDPFEPILPVLEAASPVGEYRKITEEILRRMPDDRRHPRAAAEAVRSFLLLRLGLHTGLRQKNLRELLLCPKGELPTVERRLEDMKRGELRWSPRAGGWEILIPSVAFKNANSSFFGAKPFRLVLPDLGGLYDQLNAYVGRHRQILLGPAADPGTFFVKTAKVSSTNAAYNQTTFYEAWRLVIQRYGIYNPYTGRGAIEGLLPHGPHNVRDVLATHILKQTGSYEQASYAIQDTAEMVAQHYGRFLPQDKVEIAARILNQVWEAA